MMSSPCPRHDLLSAWCFVRRAASKIRNTVKGSQTIEGLELDLGSFQFVALPMCMHVQDAQCLHGVKHCHHTTLYHGHCCAFRSIRKAAEKIKAKNIPLHILIANAGLFCPPHAKTEEGFEVSILELLALMVPMCKC